jgi:hypothetical protein
MPDPAGNITVVNGQVWELVIRFAFNFLIAFILIRLIYYRSQKNPTYAFTYFMFNVLIFFVCYLLSNVTLSIGFAFGLFAVFAILRYRTDPIPIKEMTYLFMVITIGVMNALSTPDISLLELLFSNGAIVLVAFSLESYWRKTTLNEALVVYEKIENIKPENQAALLSDLRERTGLDIVKYKMVRTDFLRDVARIRVYYRSSTDQD